MSDIEARTIDMVVTRKGLNALAARMATNTQYPISHMAFGDANGSGYTPGANRSALVNERVRVPVSQTGTKVLGDGRVQFQCLLSETVAFWVREGGIYGEDGTLFAVWSDPDGPVWEKVDGVSKIVALTVLFGSFDSSNLTFVAGGPDVNILVEDEIYDLSMSQLDNTLRWMRQYDRDLAA